MPTYGWLFEDDTNFDILKRKFEVMRQIGVPYSDEQVNNAPAAAREQAAKIASALTGDSPVKNLENKEIIALIAYLQRLGKNPELLKLYESKGVEQ